MIIEKRGNDRMKAEFHKGNRERLYAKLPEGSLLVMFSGEEVWSAKRRFFWQQKMQKAV